MASHWLVRHFPIFAAFGVLVLLCWSCSAARIGCATDGPAAYDAGVKPAAFVCVPSCTDGLICSDAERRCVVPE